MQSPRFEMMDDDEVYRMFGRKKHQDEGKE